MALTQTSEGGLKISNAGTNGQFLQKQSGNTGGLTWATPSTGGGSGTDYDDNIKVKFGTGDDLEIYHDATNSIIDNKTNDLYIKSVSDVFITPGTTEAGVYIRHNGAVELYYDNSNKLQTTATGVNVDGQLVTDGASHAGDVIFQGDGANTTWDKSADDLIFNDNAGACFGTGSDLKIYHDGNNNKITTSNGSISLESSGESMLDAHQNGAIVLYHDNIKTFETTANGVKVTAPENNHARIKMWADDGDDSADKWEIMATTQGQLRFYHGDSSENTIVLHGEGAVELYYDNSKKLETASAGVNVTGKLDVSGDFKLNSATNAGQDIDWDESAGSLTCQDNVKLYFGAAGDLEIYHDGSNSFIKESGTGVLKISGSAGVYINKHDNTETCAAFLHDAGCELYHNNVKKFETTATGVQIEDELKVGVNDNDVGKIEIRYSSVPAYITNSYDGTVGESTFSTNIARTSDGSAAWGSFNNSSYGAAAVQLASGTGGADIRFLTSAAANTNPTERARIQTGGGISFNGDTAADNALDDYEEGTWTPSDASGQSLTVTSSNSTYTKIGDTVIARCKLDLPSTVSSWTLKVGGLPYTVGTLDGGCNQVIHNDAQSYGWLAIAGTTYLQCYAAAATSASSWAQVTGSDVYGLNIIYKVA